MGFGSMRALLLVAWLISTVAASGCADCDGSSSADGSALADGNSLADDGSVRDGSVSLDSGTTADSFVAVDSGYFDAASGDLGAQDASSQDAESTDSSGIFLCRDEAIDIPNNADSPWTYSGLVAGDDFQLSCSGGHPGADSLLHWTAPRAGEYLFSTQGSQFDTLLTLQRDCRAESELVCADQIRLSNQAEATLQMEAGQEVFVIVDSYRDSDDKDFSLRIWEGQSTLTPSIASLDVRCSLSPNAMGAELAGAAPFDEIGFVSFELLDGAGEAVLLHNGQLELELAVDRSPFIQLDQSSGNYALLFSAPMATALDAVESVRVKLADLAGHYGAPLSANCQEPFELAADASCDIYQALNSCPAGQACSAENDAQALCVGATAPSLSWAGAAYNYSHRSIGVSAEGQDVDQDAWYAKVQLLDSEGRLLRQDPLDDASPVFEPLYVELVLDWVGDAFAGRGSMILPESVPPDAAFESLRVQVLDHTGLESSSLDALLADPIALLSGDPCDFAEAFGFCPGGEVCAYDVGELGAPTFCQAPWRACPESWPVIALDALSVTSTTWSHSATMTSDQSYAGAGSCGGGGAQVPLSFLAPFSGEYLFEINASSADALLFARSHCSLPQIEYERACQDDIDLLRGELDAAIRLRLEAGEQIFLFADGHVGDGSPGLTGDFAVHASFEGEAP